jgi:opacity protein-like surface antigen
VPQHRKSQPKPIRVINQAPRSQDPVPFPFTWDTIPNGEIDHYISKEVRVAPVSHKPRVLVPPVMFKPKVLAPPVLRKPKGYIDKDIITIVPRSGMFVSAEIGIQKVDSETIIINNGSDFEAPYNTDIYTGGDSSNQTSFGLTAGYRWRNENIWIPQYSLGLRYRHLFTNDINGQVIQYSLPEFTNYDYSLNMSSNALLLAGKIDVYKFNNIMPYLGLGLGMAFNHSSYSEVALPGVTPRISPGFGNQTSSQFTYNLGAGLDVQVTPKLSLSIGYEFEHWGALNTGPGTVKWASQMLSQSSDASHALLFSLDYMI